MYIEHVCFNLALAILVTLLADQKNAGWYTAVILVSGCVPDIDGIFSLIQSPPVFTGGIIPGMAFHLRYFHSIGILCIYAVLVAGVLAYYHRLDFRIIALFAGTGFGAHLLEDALVYNPASAVFWPLSSQEVGIGIFPLYSRDFLEYSKCRGFRYRDTSSRAHGEFKYPFKKDGMGQSPARSHPDSSGSFFSCSENSSGIPLHHPESLTVFQDFQWMDLRYRSVRDSRFSSSRMLRTI